MKHSNLENHTPFPIKKKYICHFSHSRLMGFFIFRLKDWSIHVWSIHSSYRRARHRLEGRCHDFHKRIASLISHINGVSEERGSKHSFWPFRWANRRNQASHSRQCYGHRTIANHISQLIGVSAELDWNLGCLSFRRANLRNQASHHGYCYEQGAIANLISQLNRVSAERGNKHRFSSNEELYCYHPRIFAELLDVFPEAVADLGFTSEDSVAELASDSVYPVQVETMRLLRPNATIAVSSCLRTALELDGHLANIEELSAVLLQSQANIELRKECPMNDSSAPSHGDAQWDLTRGCIS